MTKTILVVDDEKDIRDLLAYNLSKEGFAVLTAADGNEALVSIGEHPVGLVVLDIMMPGMDGLEVCKRIRENKDTVNLPVIFLTAKSAELDQITGLELGADDYIQKPISPRVLVARVKSVLRRTNGTSFTDTEEEDPITVKIGDLEIDRITHRVTLLGKEIFFPRKEFDLLYFLARFPGKIFSRETLLNEVWGDGSYVVERTVDVHVYKLREKLNRTPFQIETVKGVGYRFVE
jgi:two-component system alkaline phosphatase synthesis response regulator PhoP